MSIRCSATIVCALSLVLCIPVAAQDFTVTIHFDGLQQLVVESKVVDPRIAWVVAPATESGPLHQKIDPHTVRLYVHKDNVKDSGLLPQAPACIPFATPDWRFVDLEWTDLQPMNAKNSGLEMERANTSSNTVDASNEESLNWLADLGLLAGTDHAVLDSALQQPYGHLPDVVMSRFVTHGGRFYVSEHWLDEDDKECDIQLGTRTRPLAKTLSLDLDFDKEALFKLSNIANSGAWRDLILVPKAAETEFEVHLAHWPACSHSSTRDFLAHYQLRKNPKETMDIPSDCLTNAKTKVVPPYNNPQCSPGESQWP